MAPQLWTGTGKGRRISLGLLKHYLSWQEGANRRYLAAIRELARVRKLQSGTPGIQVNNNTQINVSGGSGKVEPKREARWAPNKEA